MESTLRELSLLEEKSALWRKHQQEQSELRRKCYEEEQRRIEEEYQRELVKIDEEFRRAAQKMKSDFSAQRRAVLRQHNGDKVSEGTVEEPHSNDKTQPKNDCSKTSYPKKDSPVSVPQSAISCDEECVAHTKGGEISKIIPADSTAVSFVSIRSLTSSANRSKRIRRCTRVYENVTMVFSECNTYETSAKQNGSDQPARRRRGRKRGDRHQLKTLLFDPGGYCVASVERVGLVWVYLPQSASTAVRCCHLCCVGKRCHSSIWKTSPSPVPRGGMLRTVSVRLLLSGTGNPEAIVGCISGVAEVDGGYKFTTRQCRLVRDRSRTCTPVRS
ncbi:uncharacterized protein LOC134287544 [Aedes albopictus]|uniref:Uncharacterized protein n=1 Tax=Aedes albopictus TaxID=7160 RepID=A0ABM1ZGR0_AEDAL